MRFPSGIDVYDRHQHNYTMHDATLTGLLIWRIKSTMY